MKKEPLPEEVVGRAFRLWWLVGLVAVFSCSLFGFAASVVVAGLFYLTGPSPDSAMMPGFLIKAGAFAVVAGASFFAARHAAKSGSRFLRAESGPVLAAGSRQWLYVIPALMVAAALVFPRLGSYPWAAPDETHHLAVARNLATLGAYASGHAGGQLVPFDTYDSVGPPVLLPVAAVFRLFGVGLVAARAVMGVYFLLLCAGLYALLTPLLKGAKAALAVVFVIFSFGSVYLARTLYGEVPALAWMVLGLLAWRSALGKTYGVGWGLAAGIAFGLAVLCKSILLLSAFAFLAALVYDRLTFRRICAAHVIAPAAGLVLTLGVWWAVQTFSRHEVAVAAGGMLGIYKHNLMLGVRSAPRNLLQVLLHPLQTIPLMCFMLLCTNCLFRRRYDPPLIVLHFLAIFYAVWWVFFTPGTMPRYLWFSATIATISAAPYIAGLAKFLWAPVRPVHWRRGYYMRAISILVAFGLAAAACLPPALRLVREARVVYALDEMHDDYAVSAWAAELPPDVAIAATWPVSGTLNFLANKPARVLETLADPILPKEVYIIDTMTRPEMLGKRQPDLRFGRYAVLTARAHARE